MQERIIEARGLTKRFGDVQYVAGVDFDVVRGELFGFLGPSGAGKSTTINLLIGLARPDQGNLIAEYPASCQNSAIHCPAQPGVQPSLAEAAGA